MKQQKLIRNGYAETQLSDRDFRFVGSKAICFLKLLLRYAAAVNDFLFSFNNTALSFHSALAVTMTKNCLELLLIVCGLISAALAEISLGPVKTTTALRLGMTAAYVSHLSPTKPVEADVEVSANKCC